jgi:hypothetical protein
MGKFMLLLHGDEEPHRSPAEMQAIVEEYVTWARKLRAENRMLDGNELKAGGKILRGIGADARVLDGPFTETKEEIGGYFLIEARDESEAIEISRECPGLRRGGAVELREIVDHSGT